MKAVVIRTFRDKKTKKLYEPGQVYEGTEERVKEIASKGFLKIEKQQSVLDGNVEQVKKALNEIDKSELEKILNEEINGKNRKRVVEHINLLLSEGD